MLDNNISAIRGMSSVVIIKEFNYSLAQGDCNNLSDLYYKLSKLQFLCKLTLIHSIHHSLFYLLLVRNLANSFSVGVYISKRCFVKITHAYSKLDYEEMMKLWFRNGENYSLTAGLFQEQEENHRPINDKTVKSAVVR